MIGRAEFTVVSNPEAFDKLMVALESQEPAPFTMTHESGTVVAIPNAIVRQITGTRDRFTVLITAWTETLEGT